MADATKHTIVIGTSQRSSSGYSDRLARPILLVLGNGDPVGDVQPLVGASSGSEFIDCASGRGYKKVNRNGTTGDWNLCGGSSPAVTATVAEAPPAPVRKKRRRRAPRKKKVVAND